METTTTPIRVTKVAAGDYELTYAPGTPDRRRFHVFRQENIYPPAWEVESITYRDGVYVDTVVNGAASYRAAVALLRDAIEAGRA